MKHATLAGGMALLVIFGGAGCAENPADQVANVQTEMVTSSVPTTPTGASDLSITAEATAPGTVLVRWQKLAALPTGHSFRVLNSASAEPTLPSAYWYERTATEAVEAEVTNVPSGKRYFRVCEYDGKACIKNSNVVSVDVR